MTLRYPTEDPNHRWALFENRFLMSTHDPSISDKGILWQLTDVKSVEMHVSGMWMVVQIDEGLTAWLRIEPGVHTIEFNRLHEAHVKPELLDSDKDGERQWHRRLLAALKEILIKRLKAEVHELRSPTSGSQGVTYDVTVATGEVAA